MESWERRDRWGFPFRLILIPIASKHKMAFVIPPMPLALGLLGPGRYGISCDIFTRATMDGAYDCEVITFLSCAPVLK